MIQKLDNIIRDIGDVSALYGQMKTLMFMMDHTKADIKKSAPWAAERFEGLELRLEDIIGTLAKIEKKLIGEMHNTVKELEAKAHGKA